MRARLLIVMLAAGTAVMVIHHYWFRVPWLPGYAGEPCLYEIEGFCGTVERNKPVDSLVLWACVLAGIGTGISLVTLFSHLVAFITVLASGKRQRLGDMAAHTLVVRAW